MDRNQWLELFSSVNWKQKTEDFINAGGNIMQASSDEGSSLIHYAIDAENHDAIEWLIAKGADINATDDMGWTALHYAVDSDIDVAVQCNLPVEFSGTKFMIGVGADADIKDSGGFTARDVAAEYGATILDRYDALLE